MPAMSIELGVRKCTRDICLFSWMYAVVNKAFHDLYGNHDILVYDSYSVFFGIFSFLFFLRFLLFSF